MKLLDRYLLRSFLIPLMYCFFGFYIFWVGVDLIAEMDEYQKNQMGFGRLFMFYLWKTPEFLNIVTPIALLLSLLYVLTRHARDHEFIAIRAAGISRLRLSAPYLTVGFLASLVLLLMNEFITPQSAEAAEKYSAPLSRQEGVKREREWAMTQFNHFGSGRVWMIETYYPDTRRMAGVHIFWPNSGEDVSEGRMIQADEAKWDSDQWVFKNGAEWSPADTEVSQKNRSSRIRREVFSEKAMPQLSENPDWIEQEYRVSQVGGLRDLRNLTLSMRQMLSMGLLERDPNLWGTQFHSILAQPWTCFVVALIALPFGFNHGSRNATAGLASSLVIVFGFFALQRFFHALGVGGKIEPWVSAWVPNLVFSGLGIGMILRCR